jgi:hypothetical protein
VRELSVADLLRKNNRISKANIYLFALLSTLSATQQALIERIVKLEFCNQSFLKNVVIGVISWDGVTFNRRSVADPKDNLIIDVKCENKPNL